jgi:hypothetical protein
MGFSATPKFPGAIATDVDLLNQQNFTKGENVPVLLNSILAGDTSLVLTTGTGSNLPDNSFKVTIDLEIIFVTSRTGDVLNGLLRGTENTTAASHAAGAQVDAFITALSHNQVAAEVGAIETALGVNLANVLVTNPPTSGQALPDGTTATTQTLGDSSGLVATDTFVFNALQAGAVPSGPAGGDLQGTYPNPQVNGIRGTVIPRPARVLGINVLGHPVDNSILPNGVTATTQSPGDNSTNLATTAYVDGSLPTSLPPNGPAGGDLAGTYPNPTVAKVNSGAVPASATIVGTNSSSQIVDASAATLANNTSGTASNLSGTPVLPNGTTATTQSASDNSTKLATTAYVDGASANVNLGDGSDGALVFDGSTTVLGIVPVANVYTLTKDLFATNLTVNNGVTIITAQYAIYCTGTFTNNGTVQNNGNNGGNGGNATGTNQGTGGAAGTGGTQLAQKHYPATLTTGIEAAGKTATTGAGTNGNAGVGGSSSNNAPDSGGSTGQVGGVGGNGGSGTSGAGGTGGASGTTPGAPTVSNQRARTLFAAQTGCSSTSVGNTAYSIFNTTNAGGGSGASGSGDGTNVGGGGGGAGGHGGNGPYLAIFCFKFVNNGTIQCNGGNGGDGGNGGTPSTTSGGCGGGGGGAAGPGGSGGILWICYRILGTLGTVQANGGNSGNGGTHGNGVGTGTNGTDGNVSASGNPGIVFTIKM